MAVGLTTAPMPPFGSKADIGRCTSANLLKVLFLAGKLGSTHIRD
jgi:hypothetical protein